MTFSHGFIDFVVLFNRSTHALWFFVLGPLWALMYYGLFRYVIRRFDLKTPGRELEGGYRCCARGCRRRSGGLAGELVAAFGGRANIQSLDACITRLRVQLVDPARASPDRLKALGATGVVRYGNNLQAIFGTRSENLKSDIEAYLRATGADLAGAAASVAAAPDATAVERSGCGRSAGGRVHCRCARRRAQHRLGRGVRADARARAGPRYGAGQ